MVVGRRAFGQAGLRSFARTIFRVGRLGRTTLDAIASGPAEPQPPPRHLPPKIEIYKLQIARPSSDPRRIDHFQGRNCQRTCNSPESPNYQPPESQNARRPQGVNARTPESTTARSHELAKARKRPTAREHGHSKARKPDASKPEGPHAWNPENQKARKPTSPNA
jgi:hypothetical protein